MDGAPRALGSDEYGGKVSTLVEVTAVVRGGMLAQVLEVLRDAGVPRITVLQAHAIGRGVDPASAKVSVVEGTTYADRAVIQFVTAEERSRMYVEVLCGAARTGRPRDGIVYLKPVLAVTKIRTGVEGRAALDEGRDEPPD